MDAAYLVVVALVSCSLSLSVIFFLAYYNFGRRAYALSWALTFCCATVLYSVTLARDSFPSFTSYWLVAAPLSCITVTLGLTGHRQRVGRPTTLTYIFIAALTYAVSAAATLFKPHFGIQIATLPLHAASMNALAVWLILTYRQRTQPVEWGLAFSCAVFALCQLAAGLVALSQGATMNPEIMSIYANINYLAMPACFLAMGMFSVLILASDLAEEMRELATIDSLTGLANRRGLNEAMTRAWAAAGRAEQPISVLLADLDSFKAINDEHGHDVGDQVLRAIAERLSTHGRGGDLIARWGGEEFVVLLSGLAATDALAIASRIDQDLQTNPVSTSAGKISVSASIGAATADPNSSNIADLLQRADAAMYEKKMRRKTMQNQGAGSLSQGLNKPNQLPFCTE